MENKGILIIAEIAQAHEGSLGILHSYIDALAETGVNAIKFQTHIAEAESSDKEAFRVNFSYVDKTRFDYWKRMEFTTEEWKGIKAHCEERGLGFMSSPFSLKAVDLLESIGTSRYKVGSGEISNLLLLNRIAETGKPVILSSGLSDYRELEQAVALFKKAGNPVSVLQCTTAYPAPSEKWGLNQIAELREHLQVSTGFSDHSGTPFACLAAAALGAEILEFHAVFDRRMFGPDAGSSLCIDEIKAMVNGIRKIENALSHPMKKEITSAQNELKTMFGKSLALNTDLSAGTVIELRHLESKKPAGEGIPAGAYSSVLGKTLKTDKTKWSFLKEEDLN